MTLSSLRIFETCLELTTPQPTLSLVLPSCPALPQLTCRLSSTLRRSLPHRQRVPQRRHWPPVQRIDVPSQRFSHVHVDLVGPLPSVCGYTHVFTVVDRSTCWPAAYPIQETSRTACINFLVEWISFFGVPATVTSDRGSQFTSSSWSAFCRSLGIQHVMTTACHPQSNGIVEQMHRWLKAALVARHSSSSWPSELPWVLLGLRSVPLEESAVSSAELVFGTLPTTPS